MLQVASCCIRFSPDSACIALPQGSFHLTSFHAPSALPKVHGLQHFIAGKHYCARWGRPDNPRAYACEQSSAASLPLNLPQGLQDRRGFPLRHLHRYKG